jgi:hypothetical protein
MLPKVHLERGARNTHDAPHLHANHPLSHAVRVRPRDAELGRDVADGEEARASGRGHAESQVRLRAGTFWNRCLF